jgi:hypothetical protein
MAVGRMADGRLQLGKVNKAVLVLRNPLNRTWFKSAIGHSANGHRRMAGGTVLTAKPLNF